MGILLYCGHSRTFLQNATKSILLMSNVAGTMPMLEGIGQLKESREEQQSLICEQMH
jgi:hypothetical protein